MNKSIRKTVLAVLLAAVSAVTASAAAMDATVVSTKGKTEVQKGAKWEPLKVGATLHRGDVIQTGFKSELILKIKNTTVTVAPLSRITIEQLAEKGNKDDTRLFLDTGSLKSDVKKTEDRRVGFTVRSPVATASVRGTILEVRNVMGGTDIIGIEGSTAAWKSAVKQTPVIAKDDEDSAEVTGNDASAVSDGQAGAGAVLVKKNMKFSGTTTGSYTPKENAEIKSTDIGGAKDPAGGDIVKSDTTAAASKNTTVTVHITKSE